MLALHDHEPDEFLSFPGLVITRMRHREGNEEASVSWERFAKRRPALARAGIRFLASGGHELPRDAPRDAALSLRALLGRRVGRIRWHAVPAELGRRKQRAETFASAWRRRLGPSELVFTQRSDASRRALAEAVAQDDAFELLLRDVWR